MNHFLNTLIEGDWTAAFAVLVWAGVFLTVAWVMLMGSDPANDGLPEWDLRLRRAGVIIMMLGLLVSVLFGGDKLWAPWPPMLNIAFGFDFYLTAALFTRHRRMQIRAVLIALGARGSSARAPG